MSILANAQRTHRFPVAPIGPLIPTANCRIRDPAFTSTKKFKVWQRSIFFLVFWCFGEGETECGGKPLVQLL